MAQPGQLALQVATPLGKQIDLEVESVQVPSVAGELGVLPGHVPLLAALRPGVLKYKAAGNAQTVAAAVGAGFVEADASHVRLVSEFFARPEDVDMDEARKDLEKAEQRMKAFTGQLGDTEYGELQKEYDWAQARIQLVAS